jgi:hypothetical protein
MGFRTATLKRSRSYPKAEYEANPRAPPENRPACNGMEHRNTGEGFRLTVDPGRNRADMKERR